MGGTSSPCLLLRGNESHQGSRCATPKGVEIYGSGASPTPGEGAITGITSTIVRYITRSIVANSCTCWRASLGHLVDLPIEGGQLECLKLGFQLGYPVEKWQRSSIGWKHLLEACDYSQTHFLNSGGNYQS